LHAFDCGDQTRNRTLPPSLDNETTLVVNFGNDEEAAAAGEVQSKLATKIHIARLVERKKWSVMVAPLPGVETRLVSSTVPSEAWFARFAPKLYQHNLYPPCATTKPRAQKIPKNLLSAIGPVKRPPTVVSAEISECLTR
jgi:hypothetical protein